MAKIIRFYSICHAGSEIYSWCESPLRIVTDDWVVSAFVKAARVKERKKEREKERERIRRGGNGGGGKEEQEEKRDEPTKGWKREGEREFRSRRTRRCIIGCESDEDEDGTFSCEQDARFKFTCTRAKERISVCAHRTKRHSCSKLARSSWRVKPPLLAYMYSRYPHMIREHQCKCTHARIAPLTIEWLAATVG